MNVSCIWKEEPRVSQRWIHVTTHASSVLGTVLGLLAAGVALCVSKKNRSSFGQYTVEAQASSVLGVGELR